MAFRSTSTQKVFNKRITQEGIVEEDLLWYGGAFYSSVKLNTIRQWSTKTADYGKTQNNLSLAQERCRLCREEWIFKQDNAALQNASITKKYFLEKKRLLDHPACSPDLNPIEIFRGLIVAKVCEGGRQNSAISEIKNAILDSWEKYLRLTSKTSL